ncbi:unnamed protein product [Arctogadus glacialis]
MPLPALALVLCLPLSADASHGSLLTANDMRGDPCLCPGPSARLRNARQSPPGAGGAAPSRPAHLYNNRVHTQELIWIMMG